MFRIARNMHIDQLRSARLRGVTVEIEEAIDVQGSDGVTLLEARSDLSAARAALAALPVDQRELVALVILDGLSYKDAAELLDIPVGTVMSRLARARRAIEARVNHPVSEAGCA